MEKSGYIAGPSTSANSMETLEQAQLSLRTSLDVTVSEREGLVGSSLQLKGS